MKKLLAMLTSISTIGSIMPMILANASTKIENKNLQANNLERNKRETLSTNDFLEFNNKYIEKINLINNEEIFSIITRSNLIEFNKQNDLYIATNNGLFFLKKDEKNLIKINNINNKINLIKIDKNDNVYFTTDNSLYIMKSGEINATKVEAINDYIYSFVIDNKNNIYYNDKNGHMFILKEGKKIQTKIEGLNDKTEKIVLDNNNNLYICTLNGIYFLNQEEITPKKINGINDRINAINFDKNNNIYIGTSDYNNNSNVYFLRYGETNPIKIEGINIVRAINIDNFNNVYFGTVSGVYLLKAGEIKPIRINGINANIWLVSFDSNNNVYFGSLDGMFFLKNKKITGEKILSGNVWDIKNDKCNSIYFFLQKNNKNNLFVIKNKKIKSNIILTKINGINYNVSWMESDDKGNIYFSTNYDIYILKFGKLIPDLINGFNEKVFRMYKINNYIYFKTNNSLFIMKQGETNVKKITGAYGEIDSIKLDNKNNIYIWTSYDGIYVLKSGETNANKIKEIDVVLSLVIDKNDNVYLGAKNNSAYILKPGQITPIKIKGINENISFIDIDNKDNIYFRSFGGGFFVLKSGETNANKIEEINTFASLIFMDNKNNNVYISTNNSLFVMKQGELKPKKIEGITDSIVLILIKNNTYLVGSNHLYILNQDEIIAKKIHLGNYCEHFIFDKKQNLYFREGGKFAYVLKKGEIIPTKIDNISSGFFYPQIDKNDNIYFNTLSSLYVLKSGETNANKIYNINSNIESFFIDNKNDNLYISAGSEIYLLKQGELKPKKIEGTNTNSYKKIWSIISNNDSIVYFLINESVYFFEKKPHISYFLKNNFNLEKINNDDDETILNNLNYLNCENNYFLNLNKMEIINKTPTSATIVATKGKYRGEVNITYKIKNKDEINNINLNDLLKKAVYFDFIDKNFHSFDKIKEIKDINTNNLSFGNVEITKNEDSKLLHSVNFKEPSCFKKRERINTSSIKKTVKIPKCDYDTKSKLVFQITTGLTKTKQENKLSGWNINPDDEIKLHDFVNLNNKQSEIINVLSNEFDLSNINKQEQEMILYSFSDVGDEIELAPHERAIFKYSVREIHFENTLNLKQKIRGTINAKIIDDNNEEQTIILSIKEAMEILQKYSLLSDEITINEDNSITFNGKAKISLTQEAEPKLIINTSIV